MVDPNSTKGAFKQETLDDLRKQHSGSLALTENAVQPKEKTMSSGLLGTDNRIFLLKVARCEVGTEEYHVFSSLEDLTEWKQAHPDYAGVREGTAVYYLVTPEQLANPKQLSDVGILPRA